MTFSPSNIRYFLKIGVPTTLGLSFILATGPEVQRHLISIINSDAPSIYSSAYKDQLTKFGSLSTWLSLGLHWIFLLMSLVSTSAVIWIGRPRKLAWYAIASLFTTFTLFDIAYGLIYNSISVKILSENLFSNFIGSVFVAILMIGIFSIADFVYKHVPVANHLKSIAAGCTIIGLGALFSSTAYYITLIFYNPIPAKIETYLSAPLQGSFAIAASKKNESNDNNDDSSFSLLPVDKPIAASISWTTMELKSLALQKSKLGERYNVSINLLSGHCTLDDFKNKKTVQNELYFSGVRDFTANFDPGLVYLSTNSDEAHSAKHEIIPGEQAFFWLDQNEKDKTLKFTQFVGDNATLNISSTADERIVLLTAPVMHVNSGRTKRIPRIFTFKSGDKNFTMQFNPLPILDDRKKGNCVALDASTIINQRNSARITSSVSKAALFAGVLIRINKNGDWFDTTADEISLRAKGSKGWIAADELAIEKMPEYTIGRLSMVQFRGNIADLISDNASITPRALSTYTAVGSLQAEFGNQGRIKISGLANSFWKDKERLNQTKWEKLDWEPKLFVFSTFAAFISLLWPLVFKRLTTDKEFDWMH